MPRDTDKNPVRTTTFSEYEWRMKLLQEKTGAVTVEIMRLVGYGSDSAYYGWRKANKVPMLCINAMDGVIAGLGIDQPSIYEPPKPVAYYVHGFDMQQLIALLNLVAVHEDNIGTRRELIDAIVAEMSRVTQDAKEGI